MFSVKVVVLCFATFAAVNGSARAANPVVAIETNHGTIKIELFEDKAPVTVKNFLQYVEDKHYDGTVFHRVISDFMIQGGGYRTGLTADNMRDKEKKTRDSIKNEASNGLSNLKGTVAMARTDDPDSATAQFFINVKDNKFLDKAGESAGYCVFGRVVDGMDVVNKIKEVKTQALIPKAVENVPVEEVVIKSVKVVKEEKK